MARSPGDFRGLAGGSGRGVDRLTWTWKRSIRTLPAEHVPEADRGFRSGDGRLKLRRERMDRREFTKVMGAVAAGMLAGSKAFAGDEKAAKKTDAKAEAHVCKGHNACKGQGADGKNACKGKGGCASAAAKHD